MMCSYVILIYSAAQIYPNYACLSYAGILHIVYSCMSIRAHMCICLFVVRVKCKKVMYSVNLIYSAHTLSFLYSTKH